jgi:hypothetical protein
MPATSAIFFGGITMTTERRITELEGHLLLLTARVAEMEQLFSASAGKLTEMMRGVEELRRINKEMARLHGAELDEPQPRKRKAKRALQ